MLFGEAHLQVSADGEASHWRESVLFNEGTDEVAILGHDGFLEHFTAVFAGKAGMLDLLPNADVAPEA